MNTRINEKVETWINQETGEVRQVVPTEIKTTDKGFDKVWLGMILAVLGLFGNKRIDVVRYIVENRSRTENTIVVSQRKISENTGVSLQTVNQTIKQLESADFLHRVVPGFYRINPAVIWRGSHWGRMAIMAKFSEEKAANAQNEANPQQEPQRAKKAANGPKEADLEQGTLPGVSLPQPEICEEIDPDSGEQCGGRLVPETREDGIWHVCERCGTGTKIHGSGCEYSQPSTPAA